MVIENNFEWKTSYNNNNDRVTLELNLKFIIAFKILVTKLVDD